MKTTVKRSTTRTAAPLSSSESSTTARQIVSPVSSDSSGTMRQWELTGGICMYCREALSAQQPGFGIGGSLISQRPQEVNKKALNMSGTLIVFQMTGPQERKALEGWVNEKGITEDLGSLLPRLKVGSPHIWSPTFLDVSRTITVLPKLTADVSATPRVGARTQERTLSPIDIEKLKTAMAATIEKTKSEDPKELRKEILALKKEIVALKQLKPETTKVETVEVSVLTDADRAHLLNLASLVKDFTSGLNRVLAVNEEIQQLCVKVAAKQAVQPARQSHVATAGNKIVEKRQRPPQDHKPNGLHRVPGLPIGEQKILTACGQYPEGATREQLTILTGYKRSSRDAYIQRLIQKDYVRADGGLVAITDDGFERLGPDFEALPTGEALQQYWLERLPIGEGAMLRILLDQGGQPVDRETLTEQTGYKRSSRDAYLQRLSARPIDRQ